MPATYHLENTVSLKQEVVYLLNLVGKSVKDSIAPNPEGIKIGFSSESDIRLSNFFLQKPGNLSLQPQPGSLYFKTEQGEPDYLATAFYLLNSLQEYNNTNTDNLGRFKYDNSYQHTNTCVHENIVQQCFDKVAEQLKLKVSQTPTQFFLSHDIDTVYESIVQDGFNIIKKGRIDLFLQLLFRAAMGRPDWLNMDLIMNIESEYDCYSTFFWLVNKGKVEANLANSDYSFKSKKIQSIIKNVDERGYENGLHKSISADSFKTELSHFTKTPVANRYHYLKFSLPDAYNAIEESGLKLDASLGFSEQVGFRNNYGLPFNPFNLKERKPYSFVEVPLHVMDTTLFKNKKISLQEKQKDVFDFFEKNKSNCVISVLWHNNFFSNYKYNGYLQFYKNILAYIKDNKLKSITQQEILDNYAL